MYLDVIPLVLRNSIISMGSILYILVITPFLQGRKLKLICGSVEVM
jgi:hypothetical protein